MSAMGTIASSSTPDLLIYLGPGVLLAVVGFATYALRRRRTRARDQETVSTTNLKKS